jgi:hypothetical protein
VDSLAEALIKPLIQLNFYSPIGISRAGVQQIIVAAKVRAKTMTDRRGMVSSQALSESRQSLQWTNSDSRCRKDDSLSAAIHGDNARPQVK